MTSRSTRPQPLATWYGAEKKMYIIYFTHTYTQTHTSWRYQTATQSGTDKNCQPCCVNHPKKGNPTTLPHTLPPLPSSGFPQIQAPNSFPDDNTLHGSKSPLPTSIKSLLKLRTKSKPSLPAPISFLPNTLMAAIRRDKGEVSLFSVGAWADYLSVSTSLTADHGALLS